jgi:hypothetical protein
MVLENPPAGYIFGSPDLVSAHGKLLGDNRKGTKAVLLASQESGCGDR